MVRWRHFRQKHGAKSDPCRLSSQNERLCEWLYVRAFRAFYQETNKMVNYVTLVRIQNTGGLRGNTVQIGVCGLGCFQQLWFEQLYCMVRSRLHTAKNFGEWLQAGLEAWKPHGNLWHESRTLTVSGGGVSLQCSKCPSVCGVPMHW